MKNKELRKELEAELLRSIDDTLNKRNAEIAKKIRNASHDASKKIAKKFYKAIADLSETKNVSDKKIVPIKKVVKKNPRTTLANKKNAVKKTAKK